MQFMRAIHRIEHQLPAEVCSGVPALPTCGCIGSGWCLSQHCPFIDPGGSAAGA
jgi:hypothetical protein